MSSRGSRDDFPTHDFMIVWGVFALVFIIVPLIPPAFKIIMRRIGRYFGIEHNDDSELDSDGRPINSAWDVEYAHLSDSKKNQINAIRAREISKRVAAFSMELSAENMVNRKSSEGYFEHDKDEFDVKKECYSCEVRGEAKETRNEDGAKETIDEANTVFQECQRETDASTEASTEVSNEDSTEDSTQDSICDDDDAKYTHIRLPLPGYDKNGIRNSKKKTSTKAVSRNKQRLKLFLFRREEDRNKQVKDLSVINESDDEVVEQNDDRRDVPIFCAICLGEYELCDRVCWASSTECTHVFHHDCMLQWLKSLGKRACKQQRFSENPSVAQVLNFAMECPCCRQSFVDKSVDVDGNDANV